ncbi:hypothetical protein MD537_21980, partial [Flavihumibacter sediminis]|nr:hypothetical protein [Flavihumibacter sediminis]
TQEFPQCYQDVFGEEYKPIETPKKLIEELFSKAKKSDQEKLEYEKELEEQIPQEDSTTSNRNIG